MNKQYQNIKNEIVKAQMQLTRFSLDEKECNCYCKNEIKNYFTEYYPNNLEKLKKDLRE